MEEFRSSLSFIEILHSYRTAEACCSISHRAGASLVAHTQGLLGQVLGVDPGYEAAVGAAEGQWRGALGIQEGPTAQRRYQVAREWELPTSVCSALANDRTS